MFFSQFDINLLIKNSSNGWQHTQAEFNNHFNFFSNLTDTLTVQAICYTVLSNLLQWNDILKFEKDFYIHYLI